MRQVRFALWAAGNILLAASVILLSWAATYAVAQLLGNAWPVALLIFLMLPVGTVLWPGWLFGQAAVSIALVRLAGRRRGALAHLKYDRYGATIELTTNDESVWRWDELGGALLLPGWRGVVAAYLLTAAGGLAITGVTVSGWPLWVSALFVTSWAAGWLWYATEVRARVGGRR